MSEKSVRLNVGEYLQAGPLVKALAGLGHYVYAYYEPDKHTPFYVGKGRGNRVIAHWKNAVSGSTQYDQFERIRHQLDRGGAPIIKFVEYNLEQTPPGEVYSVVERALQNAFGIQRVFDKSIGKERLVNREGVLVQRRNDSFSHPVLSLEAAYCHAIARSSKAIEPQDLAVSGPVLMVGLSKTYEPGYSQPDLAEMARMWWDLEHVGLDKSKALKTSHAAMLVAWVSGLVKVNEGVRSPPQIVGIWRIKHGTYAGNPKNPSREKFEVEVDTTLLKKFLGATLKSSGQHYQGPRIYLPTPA